MIQILASSWSCVPQGYANYVIHDRKRFSQFLAVMILKLGGHLKNNYWRWLSGRLQPVGMRDMRGGRKALIQTMMLMICQKKLVGRMWWMKIVMLKTVIWNFSNHWRLWHLQMSIME